MTDTIIEADGVTVRYPGRSSASLGPVSLNVDAGDSLGLVGESGSGKSTLARTLVGAQTVSAGDVRVNGRTWTSVRRTDDERRRVQMVFQDPYGALNPLRTALETVAEVIRVWDRASPRRARSRAGDLLCEVGLDERLFNRRPSQLSGGQCQRIGIARALAADPMVLIADEPTSALDVSVQARILNLLSELRRSRGLALVLVSHDLQVVRYLTDRTFVMHQGVVVESGATELVFARPEHPYTQRLMAAGHLT